MAKTLITTNLMFLQQKQQIGLILMLYKQLIIFIEKSFCHRIKFMLQSLYKILNDDRSQY